MHIHTRTLRCLLVQPNTALTQPQSSAVAAAVAGDGDNGGSAAAAAASGGGGGAAASRGTGDKAAGVVLKTYEGSVDGLIRSVVDRFPDFATEGGAQRLRALWLKDAEAHGCFEKKIVVPTKHLEVVADKAKEETTQDVESKRKRERPEDTQDEEGEAAPSKRKTTTENVAPTPKC